MANDDPFLISRDGEVWACWLNGRPAVNLGCEQNFWVAAEKLFNDLHPLEKPEPQSALDAARTCENQEESALPSAEEVERGEARYDVTIVGRLYGASGSHEVKIFDLSTRGCRAEDHSLVKAGAIVTVKVGAIGPIAAVIRWRRDKFIGLKFEDPLHPAVLESIRQQQSLR